MNFFNIDKIVPSIIANKCFTWIKYYHKNLNIQLKFRCHSHRMKMKQLYLVERRIFHRIEVSIFNCLSMNESYTFIWHFQKQRGNRVIRHIKYKANWWPRECAQDTAHAIYIFAISSCPISLVKTIERILPYHQFVIKFFSRFSTYVLLNCAIFCVCTVHSVCLVRAICTFYVITADFCAM